MKGKIWLGHLYLKDFATFENQTIEFSPGFNIILGETGSGKSLIMDALTLILGSKAKKNMIRRTCDSAVIEAHFKIQDEQTKEYFNSIGFPLTSDEVIIKRIIDKNGRNKNYLNFQLCPITTLQEVSHLFIDLVGQFENQKLLQPKYQLDLIDNYSANTTIKPKFIQSFRELQEIIQKLNLFNTRLIELNQKKDFILYQLEKIEELNPTENREAQLIHQKEELINLQNNIVTINQSIDLINNESNGIIKSLNTLTKNLDSFDFIKSDQRNEIENIKDIINELGFHLSQKTEKEFNQENLDQILDELDQYQQLKRKFGGSIETLIAAQTQFSKELSEINLLENNVEKLTADLVKHENACLKNAKTLHLDRIKTSTKLSKLLTTELQDLNMEGSEIKIDLHETNLGEQGISKVSLKAQTNPGEGFHRLSDIASGGELSRILLAMRKIISSNESISIFFFDEIDTGIGGKTALRIGSSLKDVAKKSQVISITHLPQIAKYGDWFIQVEKSTHQLNDGSHRTVSSIITYDKNKKDQAISELSPIQ